MDCIIIEHIPVETDREFLYRNMSLDEKRDYSLIRRIDTLINRAQTVPGPSALYLPAEINRHSGEKVIINEISFSGQVLAENLSNITQVFPFLVTVGPALDHWCEEFTDEMDLYLAGEITRHILYRASDHLLDHLKNTFHIPLLSMMNPGSLEGWPITEQFPLFRLLGDGPEKLGVTLNDHGFMHPAGTLSGIIFPSEHEFINCMRCPRTDCRHRRAAYKP